MAEQLEDCIENFGEDVSMLVTFPATNKWFKLRYGSEQLKKVEMSRSVAGKFLFIMKRSRPDVETAVGFLTMRVSKSDVDDWEKMKRILGFVHCNLKEKMFF